MRKDGYSETSKAVDCPERYVALPGDQGQWGFLFHVHRRSQAGWPTHGGYDRAPVRGSGNQPFGLFQRAGGLGREEGGNVPGGWGPTMWFRWTGPIQSPS